MSKKEFIRIALRHIVLTLAAFLPSVLLAPSFTRWFVDGFSQKLDIYIYSGGFYREAFFGLPFSIPLFFGIIAPFYFKKDLIRQSLFVFVPSLLIGLFYLSQIGTMGLVELLWPGILQFGAIGLVLGHLFVFLRYLININNRKWLLGIYPYIYFIPTPLGIWYLLFINNSCIAGFSFFIDVCLITAHELAIALIPGAITGLFLCSITFWVIRKILIKKQKIIFLLPIFVSTSILIIVFAPVVLVGRFYVEGYMKNRAYQTYLQDRNQTLIDMRSSFQISNFIVEPVLLDNKIHNLRISFSLTSKHDTQATVRARLINADLGFFGNQDIYLSSQKPNRISFMASRAGYWKPHFYTNGTLSIAIEISPTNSQSIFFVNYGSSQEWWGTDPNEPKGAYYKNDELKTETYQLSDFYFE